MKHQGHAKCVCKYKQDGSQLLAQETNRDATVAVWQQSTQTRDVDDIVRPVQRKLQSQHPSIRKRFNHILERQLKQQGVERNTPTCWMQQIPNLERQFKKNSKALIDYNDEQSHMAWCLSLLQLCKQWGNNSVEATLQKTYISSAKYKPWRKFLLHKAERWKFPVENLDITEPSTIFNEGTQTRNQTLSQSEEVSERTKDILSWEEGRGDGAWGRQI